MPDVTKEQVKEVLAKHGINNIDDLSNLLISQSNSPVGSFALEEPNQNQKSWVIKVWKLDKKLEELDIKDLPEALGGDILNR